MMTNDYMNQAQAMVGAINNQQTKPCFGDAAMKRIDQIRQNLVALHDIADKVCGARPPLPEGQIGIAPNGVLDEIEGALDSLMRYSGEAVSRFGRLG